MHIRCTKFCESTEGSEKAPHKKGYLSWALTHWSLFCSECSNCSSEAWSSFWFGSFTDTVPSLWEAPLYSSPGWFLPTLQISASMLLEQPSICSLTHSHPNEVLPTALSPRTLFVIFSTHSPGILCLEFSVFINAVSSAPRVLLR